MNVELHIQELILHGFAPSDRRRIGEAVEQELTRLLEREPQTRYASLDRVDAGAFRVSSGSKPAAIGAQIAGAVHGGLRE